MDNREIKALLSRYVTGQCTEEEKMWIETWYVRDNHGMEEELSAGEIEKDLREILENLPPKNQVRFLSGWARAAAVFVFIAISAGLYFYGSGLRWSRSVVRTIPSVDKVDVLPGGNRALLTLADGRTLVLDSASNGKIANQPGISISKTAEGLITYASRDGWEESKETVYNSVSTPRGGQYRITLSDGTKVWLNAASSLRYPAKFGPAERKVALSGEAYFEVATTRTPFFVETKNQTIEVLGTHFNINAYEDELAVRTTLLEGSVRVVAGHVVSGAAGKAGPAEPGIKQTSTLLRPGQQSIVTTRGLSIEQVDPAVAIAWKNGLFRFENTDVEQVMRQISRWYDVDVEFRGKSPDIRLWGEVYRNVNASQVLEILAYFNLEYQIIQNNESKKIIIHR